MRVVCDSCGATYKIPDTKLVKDVNRATCRKCGHRMLIRKPDAPVGLGTYPSAATEEERTVIASAADLERRAREHLAAAQAATGTRLGARPPHAEEDPTIVKTLASVQGSNAGLAVARSRTEVPAAPARIQRHPPEEMPTTVSSSIERMPERHVSQSLGPAQPIPSAPRVESGMRSGAVFDAPRGGPASFDSPRGAPASFDSPRGAPASFDSPRGAPASFDSPSRGGGAFDPHADAARRSVGRQAVVIDQVMRPPVPVAPMPQPAPISHSGFTPHPNGGAGAAMPAPATPVPAPQKHPAAHGSDVLRGIVMAAVLLVLLGTVGAAAYVWTRAPVEMSPERVDKVTTEQPAEEPQAEAAPAEEPIEAPTEDAAAAEPTPSAEVAEAAPPPVQEEPAPVEKPEPAKPSTRSSRSASRSSGSSSSKSSSRESTPSNAIEIPETPPTAKSVAATPKPTTAKSTEPEVSDADLLGEDAPAAKPTPTKTVAPPPIADEEPAAEVLDTLPLTVLDTIVRNNKNIKRCFFNEQQKTGVLPSVSVKMKIETNGSVSAASVAEPAAQQGTDLDACLSSAFKGLQFPAFKTPMGAVTYPFKF